MEQLLQAAPVASVIFVITIIATLLAFYNENLYYNMMLHPYSVSRGERVWTVITSGLIHRDWMHLFFNMWSFYFFAFNLEATMGHWQFGLLYGASLILSDLPTVSKYKDNYSYHSLGASGAISAVVFGFIMFNPMAQMGIFPIPFAIPAIVFGVLYLAYCYYASKQSLGTINHDAHFYGALSGIMITILLNHGIVSYFLHQLGL